MSAEVTAAVRGLVRLDPRLAIVVGEILGVPVGAADGPVRPWEK